MMKHWTLWVPTKVWTTSTNKQLTEMNVDSSAYSVHHVLSTSILVILKDMLHFSVLESLCEDENIWTVAFFFLLLPCDAIHLKRWKKTKKKNKAELPPLSVPGLFVKASFVSSSCYGVDLVHPIIDTKFKLNQSWISIYLACFLQGQSFYTMNNEKNK